MKIRSIISVLLLVTASLSGSVLGASGTAEADSAYKSGDFERAITLYEEIADKDGVSAGLLYNLGNANVEAHDYGKAVLYYERALRLDPSDKEIRRNLRYVTAKVEDANRSELKGKRLKITPDEQSFFQSVYTSLACERSSDMWAAWGAALFLLSLTGVALYMFSRNVPVRKIGFFGALAGICLSIAAITCAFAAAGHYDTHEEGVLTGYKVELFNTPEANSQSIGASLTRGTKVRIVGEETDVEGEVTWYRVRLNSDFIGWVRAADLTVI